MQKSIYSFQAFQFGRIYIGVLLLFFSLLRRKCFSLCLLTSFCLKSVLLDIRITIPGCFLVPFVQNTFFHAFTRRCYHSLMVKYVSGGSSGEFTLNCFVVGGKVMEQNTKREKYFNTVCWATRNICGSCDLLTQWDVPAGAFIFGNKHNSFEATEARHIPSALPAMSLLSLAFPPLPESILLRSFTHIQLHS